MRSPGRAGGIEHKAASRRQHAAPDSGSTIHTATCRSMVTARDPWRHRRAEEGLATHRALLILSLVSSCLEEDEIVCLEEAALAV
eukprot:scaffold47669_cov58-Phaeocystis_antarctica.AAC.2